MPIRTSRLHALQSAVFVLVLLALHADWRTGGTESRKNRISKIKIEIGKIRPHPQRITRACTPSYATASLCSSPSKTMDM